MKSYYLLIVSFVLFTGCSVVPIGLSYSTTPLEKKDGEHLQYNVLGQSEGESGYFSLFGIIPFGQSDFEAAINDAVKKFNGDALINVRYWVRTINYVIGTYTRIEIEGDVIKIKN